MNNRPNAAPADSIFLNELNSSRTGLSSKLPLVFHPTFDKDEHYFSIIVPLLGINVFAKTRAALVNELEEVLPVLWEQYAKEDSALLTVSAQRLKTALLQTFSETAIA